MGLDARIVRVRNKYSNLPVEELYEMGKYVNEFRNIWHFPKICNMTREEINNGLFYRIVNTLPIHDMEMNDGLESERLLNTYNSMDFEKFIYIIKIDW